MSLDERLDIRELQAELDDLIDRRDEEQGEPLDDVEVERLADLEAFLDELPSEVVQHGAPLIAESDFEDYVRDYAEQTAPSGVDYNAWPFNEIDWSEAADTLRSDFDEVEFEGVTYYFESY